MADEIPPTAPETPEVQTPPPPAPVQAAPPPAASVVLNGSRREGEPLIETPAPETELENLREERDENLTPAARRKLEVRIAELEKENENLREIPAAPKAKKEKRHNWLSPVIGADDEE